MSTKSVIIVGKEDPSRRRLFYYVLNLFLNAGAGAGGIATATKLAKAGFQVTVVEKHGFVGGRCSLIRHDGYVSLLFFPCRFLR